MNEVRNKSITEGSANFECSALSEFVSDPLDSGAKRNGEIRRNYKNMKCDILIRKNKVKVMRVLRASVSDVTALS